MQHPGSQHSQAQDADQHGQSVQPLTRLQATWHILGFFDLSRRSDGYPGQDHAEATKFLISAHNNACLEC